LFSDGGSVTESEIWGDRAVLQGAYRRGDSVQSVRLKLTEPDCVAQIEKALQSDPRVNVAVASERDFYASQSKALVTLVTTLGSLIAFLMGIGAVFGALNTMYSAVAARTREIATLRAIGFPGYVVLLSVVTESMLLGLLGGVLGGGVAYVTFNGVRATTLNFQTFSQLTFAFDVSIGVVVNGIIYALLLGLIGGLWPGIRAARLSVIEGLRAV
jgi:putative ABC transport system permease protein